MSSFPPDISDQLAQRATRVKGEHAPEVVDNIVRGAFEGDPIADRLVDAFKEMPGGTGWKMLDQALEQGPDRVKDAPPELAELLAPAITPPEWVDLDLADAGANAYWRSGGLNLGLALICGSLAYGYKSARLTRPLAATGRLEKMAPRRIQETSRWVAVATKPGALRPGAEGIKATIRLRMVHALVRRHLAADPTWNRPDWGTPISAADSLVTGIGGFMTIPIEALRDLGVRFSPAELEAMTHQWTWIASLMGTPDYLIPRTYREAQETMAAALALDDPPLEEGPQLMKALLYYGVEFPLEDKLPGLLKKPMQEFKARYIGGFARRWMDEEMADFLGVPRTRVAQMALFFLRPLTLFKEVARALNLLGSDERIAQMELAFVEKVSAARFGPVETIAPQQADDEPVLSAAA